MFAGGKIDMFESNPGKFHEDLATQFNFVCSKCNKTTVFSNSPFSKMYPNNYSINKHLMPQLGTNAFFKLVQFVQKTEFTNPNVRSAKSSAQLVLSMDNYKFSLLPKNNMECVNPTANIMGNPNSLVLGDGTGGIKLQPQSFLFNSPNSLPKPVTNNVAAPVAKSSGPIKIKASNELPAGSKLSKIPPGTKISGEIKYTTKAKTGLDLGVYKVMKEGEKDRYLVVKAEHDSNSLLKPIAQNMPMLPLPSSMLDDSEVDPLAISDDPLQPDPDLVDLGDNSDPGEEEFDDDPSQFLQMNMDSGDNNDVTIDNFDKNAKYVGWQNNEQNNSSDGSDSDYDPSDERKKGKKS